VKFAADNPSSEDALRVLSNINLEALAPDRAGNRTTWSIVNPSLAGPRHDGKGSAVRVFKGGPMDLEFKGLWELKDSPSKGKVASPSKDGESSLESLLHRRCRKSGRFVSLVPNDRQLYLPLLERKAD
jgi:hypothetical protein